MPDGMSETEREHMEDLWLESDQDQCDETDEARPLNILYDDEEDEKGESYFDDPDY